MYTIWHDRSIRYRKLFSVQSYISCTPLGLCTADLWLSRKLSSVLELIPAKMAPLNWLVLFWAVVRFWVSMIGYRIKIPDWSSVSFIVLLYAGTCASFISQSMPELLWKILNFLIRGIIHIWAWPNTRSIAVYQTVKIHKGSGCFLSWIQ